MVDSERIKSAVVELLAAIGEDPNRSELAATPTKVAEDRKPLLKNWLGTIPP